MRNETQAYGRTRTGWGTVAIWGFLRRYCGLWPRKQAAVYLTIRYLETPPGDREFFLADHAGRCVLPLLFYAPKAGTVRIDGGLPRVKFARKIRRAKLILRMKEEKSKSPRSHVVHRPISDQVFKRILLLSVSA